MDVRKPSQLVGYNLPSFGKGGSYISSRGPLLGHPCASCRQAHLREKASGGEGEGHFLAD